MKKLSLLLVLSMIFIIAGCPKKVPPPPPEQPKVTQPEVKPEEKPAPKEEPVIKKVSESDFMTVYFDFDKYNLVDSATRALDINAQLLKDNPDLVVRIEGNCDERGTVEYNLSLGEKRANAAKKYLMDLGIAEGRLQTISYGKEKPVALGHDEASWAKNRRDDFRIISQ
jgi:peptidoglycan-associated lipoprotein